MCRRFGPNETLNIWDSINGRVGDEELNDELTPCKLRRSVQMIFYQSRFWFSTDPILRLRSSAENK